MAQDEPRRHRRERDHDYQHKSRTQRPRKQDRDNERDEDGEEDRRRRREERRRKRIPRSDPSISATTSTPLSLDSLAKLNHENQRSARQSESRDQRKGQDRKSKADRRDRIVVEVEDNDYVEIRPQKRRRKRPELVEIEDEELIHHTRHNNVRRKKRRRDVSGALLEEGSGPRLRGMRGGRSHASEYDEKRYTTDDTTIWKKHKRKWICLIIFVVLLAIIIPVAIVVSKKGSASTADKSASGNGVSNTDVPMAARNTQMDPSIWLDVTDFNTTFTNVTVGGLPIMGLNTTYSDATRANSYVASLDSAWGSYATIPARGVNLGGWLSIEPFITPSLFKSYDTKLGIIDEYTLCQHLGPSAALATLEKHYSTFVTEQTFIDIQNAGLDHVRIPFSYWAWQVYDNDPYVFRTSWRYLLRAIEWARKHGLRINLDLHGIPGSQNGWNHSGRQGDIGWLNGTDGAVNAQRSIDMHNALSQFFAQDRYKNIIAFYGLCNEPKMTALNSTAVQAWSAQVYTLVRKNGLTNPLIVIGDGFRGLENWKGELQGYSNLLLDVHQYVIFNTGQIIYNHTQKVNYACSGWTQQAQISMSTSTGFGPTLFAEWSQADTDCATYLNNIGWGNRWTGTYTTGNALTQVLSPTCPVTTGCDCTNANADPSTYSAAYKQFLLMFAEAQMHSFEVGYGWFYWTWKTESAPQWSYQAGLKAGILPAKAYARSFNCSSTVPDFRGAGLSETY